MRLFKWWNLERATKAADLGVKLATILGVIVVANFLTLKPRLQWDLELRHAILDTRIEEIYDKGGVPAPVSKAVEIINSYFALFGDIAFASTVPELSAAFRHVTIATPGPGIATAPSTDEYFASTARGVFFPLIDPYDFQGILTALNDDELTDKEVDSAIDALWRSFVTEVTVTIENTGGATARGVSVGYPYGFSPPDGSADSFDLPPGASATVTLTAEGPEGYGHIYSRDDFPVRREPSEVRNTRCIIAVAIGFFILWLLTFFREVWSFSQDNL